MNKKARRIKAFSSCVGLVAFQAIFLFCPVGVIANSPIPEECKGEGFDPLKATDTELLDHWCNALHDPVFYKWRASKKLKHLPLSCLLKVTPAGVISTITIYKPSSSKNEDKMVIELLHKVTPPKMGRDLSCDQEIILQFFKSIDLRMKLKKGEKLEPIGPLKNSFDPQA